ncbi:MAG: TlpA family protein disulfide reductase [Actinomycetota bacterium]
MAQNPDPNLSLTSIKGVTRTLDDWATVFNLAVVLLPARPEAAAFVPVIERIFATFGDSDVRTCISVTSNEAITRRIIRTAADRYLVFCDPDGGLAATLGLERLPAFVHLRQDTSLVTAAQGWSPSEWQRVADEIARTQHWTSPVVSGRGDPPPSPGWPIAS